MSKAPTLLNTIEETRAWSRQARASGTVGFVPTMGALHAGHAELIRTAVRECDHVAVSIYVNPTQFGPNEDLAKYPRTFESDIALCRSVGVAAVFAPTDGIMYPAGKESLSVVHVPDELTTTLEGAIRPGHFDGVATVVTLLFNMTQPDAAFFGEKDWQQLQLVRQLVADLKLPLDIVPCPCVRAGDGLALSSRNQRLSSDARARAGALPRALFDAARRIEAGDDPAQVLAGAEAALALASIGPVEYLALRDGASLGDPQPGRPARLLVAAWLEGVRLIDNVAVTLPD